MTEEEGVIEQEAAAPGTEVSAKSNKELNFELLRHKTEQLERDLERERQEKQSLMQMRQPIQQQPQAEPDFDWNSLETEDFIEGKKVSNALKHINKKLSEKDKKIALLEAAVSNAGFNDVVTEQNVKKYIMNDPDFVDLVRNSSNPGQAMFKLISKNADYLAEKALKEQKAKPISQELKKLAEDAGKPKSSPVGVRSESIKHAAKFSELSRADRAALWEETQRLSRKVR